MLFYYFQLRFSWELAFPSSATVAIHRNLSLTNVDTILTDSALTSLCFWFLTHGNTPSKPVGIRILILFSSIKQQRIEIQKLREGENLILGFSIGGGIDQDSGQNPFSEDKTDKVSIGTLIYFYISIFLLFANIALCYCHSWLCRMLGTRFICVRRI